MKARKADKPDPDRRNLWRKRNPAQRRAWYAVANAKRRGKIQVPKKCERCDKRRTLYAHHEDYAKPLQIIWVCHSCHVDIHLAIVDSEEVPF